MAEFLYTPNPKNVTEFFEKMKIIGVPKNKVTTVSIKQYGFKSSNDRYLVGVLKTLGFLNNDNMPTERWTEYRDKSIRRSVLAQAISEAYSDLLATYEDAYRKDDEVLKDYFVANSKAGDRTITFMVDTFKNLCEMADFKDTPTEISSLKTPAPLKKEVSRTPEKMHNLTVNINIQLALPATDDESIYDKLFSSLKNNLLS